MKTNLKTIAAFAATVFAAAFTTSCDIVDQISSNVEVGDFSFNIDALATETRADGDAVHFAGSQTITREQLLEGAAKFDYDMVKSATIDNVSIEVQQELGDVTIEDLQLMCGGLTPVEIKNVALSDIASTQQEALKTFASGVIMEIIGKGEATVSLDMTLDRAVSEETVSYLIALSGITVSAGLNL
jgi:hypothetical protein